LIFLEGRECGEAGLAMHHMPEVAVGRIPGEHGAEGALRRVRRSRGRGSASGRRFRQGGMRRHGHRSVAEVVGHAVASFVVPAPQLGHPGVRRLHVEVEILGGLVLPDEALVLGSQEAHVLLEHRVAGAVDEPRGDRLDGLG